MNGDSMTRSRSPILFGIVGGVLSALGFSLLLAEGLFVVFLHHMFIVGIHWPSLMLVLLLPALFIGSGLLFIRRALHG